MKCLNVLGVKKGLQAKQADDENWTIYFHQSVRDSLMTDEGKI